MDVSDLHPPDDYSHRFFIWHEWIQANGPLTKENVFDYFATSMFYDKQSNNQVLRMQTMHTGMPVINEAEELKRFTGVEFAVVHAVPPSMFIIHKRERISSEEVRPLAAYFIMNNRIYQSPDLYTVLSNRLLTSLHSLQSSLDILRAHRPDFTPRTGFVWPIIDPTAESNANKIRSTSEGPPSTDDQRTSSEAPGKRKTPTAVTGPKRPQNDVLLLNAMRTTAAHSNIAFMSSSAFPTLESTTSEAAISTVAKATVRPADTIVTTAPIQDEATARPTASAPQPREPPQKGPAGAGRKKRRRTLLVLPAP